MRWNIASDCDSFLQFLDRISVSIARWLATGKFVTENCGNLAIAMFWRSQIIEFFRGRPRGGDNFTSLVQVLQTFIQSVKAPFLTSRLATLSGAPRQAQLDQNPPIPINIQAMSEYGVATVRRLRTCPFVSVGSSESPLKKSDAPRKITSESSPPILKEKAAN